jgi:hypothetical protein
MSGPVSTIDAPPTVAEGSRPSAACVEVTDSRLRLADLDRPLADQQYGADQHRPSAP